MAVVLELLRNPFVSRVNRLMCILMVMGCTLRADLGSGEARFDRVEVHIGNSGHRPRGIILAEKVKDLRASLGVQPLGLSSSYYSSSEGPPLGLTIDI